MSLLLSESEETRDFDFGRTLSESEETRDFDFGRTYLLTQNASFVLPVPLVCGKRFGRTYLLTLFFTVLLLQTD